MEKMTVIALRASCRRKGLVPDWRHDDGRKWLTKQEMLDALERIDKWEVGKEKWLLREGVDPPMVSTWCHAFWVDVAAMRPRSTSSSSLPGFGQLGLASACRAGLKVVVWCYGSLYDAPYGFGHLEVKDASELMPKAEAVKLLERGLRIQHLSDWIRFLAVKKHHADFRHGAGRRSTA